jgi:hypothetical protein
MVDTVKSSDLGIKFPDPASVRALRRGTVTCGTLPPPPATKSRPPGKKGTKGKETTPTTAKAEPAAKPELLPGPCTLELLPSAAVRSID